MWLELAFILKVGRTLFVDEFNQAQADRNEEKKGIKECPGLHNKGAICWEKGDQRKEGLMFRG